MCVCVCVCVCARARVCTLAVLVHGVLYKLHHVLFIYLITQSECQSERQSASG